MSRYSGGPSNRNLPFWSPVVVQRYMERVESCTDQFLELTWKGGGKTNEQSRFWHFLVLEKECVQIDAEYMH